jgi:hypothetical protein
MVSDVGGEVERMGEVDRAEGELDKEGDVEIGEVDSPPRCGSSPGLIVVHVVAEDKANITQARDRGNESDQITIQIAQ